MNLTYFQPRKRRNVENNNNCPLNIRFVAKISDIRNFSQNIRSGNTGNNSNRNALRNTCRVSTS